jgi:hypothetical protein
LIFLSSGKSYCSRKAFSGRYFAKEVLLSGCCVLYGGCCFKEAAFSHCCAAAALGLEAKTAGGCCKMMVLGV